MYMILIKHTLYYQDEHLKKVKVFIAGLISDLNVHFFVMCMQFFLLQVIVAGVYYLSGEY